MDDATLGMVICPGCGWIGTIEGLSDGVCPNCRYENNLPPLRLLTIKEMLEDDEQGEYDGVRMDLFLASLFRVLYDVKGKDEMTEEKVGEKFVIQYQRLQRVDWYDDPSFSPTIVLAVAQSRLRDDATKKAQDTGVRYRIVKRTIWDKVMR